MPVCTLVPRIYPPTAKPLVQVEPPIALNTTAIPRLQIRKPIARNIDKRRDAAGQNARRDEYNPHLARIGQLLERAEDAPSAGVQVLQSLALLCVLEDPVNRRAVVVADAAPGALDVPV